MQKFDVTVIGGGPGGYVAAIRAAQNGAKVALIEKEFLGGTCLNIGCIPTKTLIAGGEVLDKARHAAEFGITISGEIKPDWTAMLARKDKIVKTLRQGIGGLVKGNNIELFTGTGALVSRKEIEVTAEDGSKTRLETKTVILASGSDTVKPKFIPVAANVFYSREALERPALPETLLVLGGGVIGSEFACLYARLGVKVTLVEMLPEILPMVDADVARVVRGEMEKLGITIMTGTKMSDITADGRTVTAVAGDKKLEAQAMLVCIGRRAVTETLNLKAIGLEPNAQGVLAVDEHCRTRIPGFYAIGDITGTIQYAHRASAMGICAANHATGKPADTYREDTVPGCIFTVLEIGSVGLTETQAKEKGLQVKVGKFPFSALGKAMAIGETKGFCKVIADAGTDQVLGIHLVGPHATDLVAEAATAMNLEITAEELGRAVHAHPTLAEAMMEAAHAVHGACIHLPPPRKPAH